MNSETWHNISIVFLVSGIVFLLTTVILSIKFQLFSILKSEIEMKKESTDSSDYLDNAVSGSRAVKADDGITENEGQKVHGDTYSFDSNVSQPYEMTPPITEQSATVIAPRDSQSSETVIVSDAERQVQSADFTIKNSILVMHGDPSAIKRF